MIAAINACRAKRLSGELKTYLASAQCSNPLITQAYTRVNYRYMDLVALMVAKRTQIAEKQDHGQFSDVDANEALQQAFTDIVTAERQRDAMKK